MSYQLQWIPARFWGSGQPSNDGDVVTMHTVEASCIPGMAVSLARNWFQSQMIGSDGKSHPASATAMMDPTNSVQMVSATRIAWHCGDGNRRGIGIEMAGFTTMTRQQWLGDNGIFTMLRAAEFAWNWMKPRGVPIKWLTSEQTRNGARGINGHINMSQAYGGSDHSDPDDGRTDRFPHDVFLQMVGDYAEGRLIVATQAEINAIADAVWAKRVQAKDPKGRAISLLHPMSEWTVNTAMSLRDDYVALSKRHDAAMAAIGALSAALAASEANDLTAEQVKAIVDTSIEEHAPPAPPVPEVTT
jgi:hypothetical protein